MQSTKKVTRTEQSRWLALATQDHLAVVRVRLRCQARYHVRHKLSTNTVANALPTKQARSTRQ